MTVKELIEIIKDADPDMDISVKINDESASIYSVDYDMWGGITIYAD